MKCIEVIHYPVDYFRYVFYYGRNIKPEEFIITSIGGTNEKCYIEKDEIDSYKYILITPCFINNPRVIIIEH